MKTNSFKHSVALLATGLLSVIFLPTPIRADVIYPGWDLLTSIPIGTMFNGVHYGGVPLWSYDFPGVGTRSVGVTDTIVRRGNPPAPSGPGITVPGTFPLYLEAMQLKSQIPVGSDYAYVTLQSVRGGPASVGQMDISPGSFSTVFDVYFDVRDGGLSGPILQSGSVTLTSTGGWSHDAPPDAVKIEGVNYRLNGVDTSNDFWLLGNISHDASGAAHHLVTATIPEPGQVAMMVITLLGATGFTIRSRLTRK